ncbi:MAG: hypothetical protein IJV85_05390 [Clostridia bacterium]|nr:hypothetical protein [Clostridia bacterium]
MLCCNCKKNQATKTYEQIKKGKKETTYYCLECYQQLFICADEGSEESLSECPYCGMTAEEIKKKKLVGCAYCYRVLSPSVIPMILKMQGAKIHTGKKPIGEEAEYRERRRGELQAIVDKLIAEKDFNGAKAYADELSRLKGGADEQEGFIWRELLNS